jgi:hypothetical protein
MPTEAPPVDDAGINAAIEADLAGLEVQGDEGEASSPLDQVVEVPATDDTPPSGDTPTTYVLPDGTEVPLAELEKGYLRQSDYTRKTQDLAQQREEMAQLIRLAEALDADPEGTLDALRSAMLGDQDNEDLDPVAQKLAEHDQFIQAQNDAAFERQLQADLDQIESRFGEFDREAVLQHAIDYRIPNLRAAYLDWSDEQTALQARETANAAAVAAKRQGGVVHKGGGRALGSDAPQLVEVKTLDDALRNALAEHPEIDWS